MTDRTGCIGILVVIAFTIASGFFCVTCAGEGIHNTDAPMFLRVVSVAAGAVFLAICIALTYLVVSAFGEAWRDDG